MGKYTYVFAGIGVAGILFLSAGALARPASAATIDDLQAQVRQLLLQIASLQNGQTAVSGTATASGGASVATPVQARACMALYRNLSRGMEGDDVRSLQEFLQTQGYFAGTATGYYGPVTAQAVARWQTSQGVSAVGAFGPLSRERFRVWCGGGGGGGISTGSLDASPRQGAAPLAVDFTYHPTSDEYGQYYIDFGDGQGQLMEMRQIYCIRAPCISPYAAPHTYVSSGTYSATVSRYIACLYTNPRCMVAQPPPLAQMRIVVTGSSCPALPPPSPCPPGYSAQWYYDSNGCRVSSSCVTSGNRPPVISGFSGPTTLAVNQSGTWSISASDPENGPLSYSIAWGDEYAYPPYASSAARESFVQTTTFTHAYASAGTYTIAVVVRDDSGQEARTSSAVRIGDQPVACTADAMQCPNGQWVGRTGPNCQFVCPSTAAGAKGRVTAGPTCPVETFPPNPNCAPSAVQTVVNVYRNSAFVKSTSSDASGYFSVALDPGTYELRANESACATGSICSGTQYPICTPQSVVVNQSGYTTADISCDTGIR
ncbi:MAG: hypothetical protein RLZZ416_21 [Candidatus Parcubacteria bacterium]|jgi:hypothetical protein